MCRGVTANDNQKGRYKRTLSRNELVHSGGVASAERPFAGVSSVPAGGPHPRATLDETCFVQGEHGEDRRGQRLTPRFFLSSLPVSRLCNAFASRALAFISLTLSNLGTFMEGSQKHPRSIDRGKGQPSQCGVTVKICSSEHADYTSLIISFVHKSNLRQISRFHEVRNMSKIFQPAVLRVVLLPIVGALGTVIAMAWPLGHKAFCAGLSGLPI